MSIPVAFQKQLGPNDAIFIQDESPRIRHPFGKGSFGCGLVVNFVSLDDFAVRIGQDGESHGKFLGELVEYFYLVVTDSDYLNLGRFQILPVVLQLNQLLDTKWSPTGGAVKHQSDFVALVQEFG